MLLHLGPWLPLILLHYSIYRHFFSKDSDKWEARAQFLSRCNHNLLCRVKGLAWIGLRSLLIIELIIKEIVIDDGQDGAMVSTKVGMIGKVCWGGMSADNDEGIGNVVTTIDVGTWVGIVAIIWVEVDVMDSSRDVSKVGRGEEVESIPTEVEVFFFFLGGGMLVWAFLFITYTFSYFFEVSLTTSRETS